MATIAHKNLRTTEIHEPKGAAAAEANCVYVSDGAGSGTWTSLNSVQGAAPPGIIGFFPNDTAPNGWLSCHGQEVSRSTYANLFAVIGTAFGVGDGATTFNVPDFRGRILAGLDNLGGVSADRVTAANADSMGGVVGTETITLSTSHIPELTGSTSTDGAHTHTYQRRTTGGSIGNGGQLGPAVTDNTGPAGAHSHTVTVNSGGGGAHPNVQPTLFLNVIIYSGVFE